MNTECTFLADVALIVKAYRPVGTGIYAGLASIALCRVNNDYAALRSIDAVGDRAGIQDAPLSSLQYV